MLLGGFPFVIVVSFYTWLYPGESIIDSKLLRMSGQQRNGRAMYKTTLPYRPEEKASKQGGTERAIGSEAQRKEYFLLDGIEFKQ